MKVTRKVILIILVSVFTFWQCDDEPEAKEPDCAIECDIGTEEYLIDITCESGPTSTTYNSESTEYQYDNSGELSGLKLHLNRSRTYENTKNTYEIVGIIDVNLEQNTVTHSITVSGGVFNDSQTCN